MILATSIAPAISMINSIEDILVMIPNNKTIPPITSKRAIGNASWGGSPREPKKPWVLPIPDSFGRPCMIKAIPAIILEGRGEKM